MSSTIQQEVTFNATPTAVYEALMDSAQHSGFTGAPAEISRDVGGAFTCYGGGVSGRNIELIPNQRIVQAWRAGGWAEGVYTIIRFELHREGSGTRLVFEQTAIPDGAMEHLSTGWQERYWEPLAKYLG
jgi:activator of HSP90 ATPase